MTSPEHIEMDIAEKGRTLEALKAERLAGREVISPERARAMEQSLADEERHLAEFRQQQGEIPKLPSEFYEEQVRNILTDVVSLESAFEFALKNKLTKAKLQILHDGLDAAQEKLQELDEKAEEPAKSKERRALMSLINNLRAEYPATMQQIDLSGVRDVHQRVKASYASIQHTLTLDQRREMRTRIAVLSSLVRRAEDERLAQVGSAVLAAVSHATEHAPAVAHAAVVRVPSRVPTPTPAKKSLLATLTGAFRLK